MSLKSSTCCINLFAPILAVMLGFVMFFGNPDEARAEGGWTLTSSASFLYMAGTDCGGCEVSTDFKYYGGSISAQPEYRFTNWFGLGLDVGLAGMSFETANDDVSDYNMLLFQFLVAFKFIAPLKYVDLWGEIGAGLLVSEYKNVGFPIRFRIGATVNLLDGSMGVGVHAGFGDLGTLVIFDSAIDAGVHFVKRF